MMLNLLSQTRVRLYDYMTMWPMRIVVNMSEGHWQKIFRKRFWRQHLVTRICDHFLIELPIRNIRLVGFFGELALIHKCELQIGIQILVFSTRPLARPPACT